MHDIFRIHTNVRLLIERVSYENPYYEFWFDMYKNIFQNSKDCFNICPNLFLKIFRKFRIKYFSHLTIVQFKIIVNLRKMIILQFVTDWKQLITERKQLFFITFETSQ